MNKIYKIVWNKARNCYVVASEFAKSHSQSNKRVRSMTAVVAAAMMLTGFGGMAIEAANPASGDTNITIGKGASSAIWNGVLGHEGFTSGYISIGENAYAWDGEHTYNKKYARIGTKEYLLDFNQGAVGGTESFLGIPYKFRVTDGTKLAGAIAIGKNTMARTGSVMIGDHTYKGQLGDIEVDPSNKMNLNNGVYATTLGTSSYNSGSMATVTGAFSIASGKDKKDTQNFGATIYGSLNSIESSTTDNSASGMANSVLGFGNRTQNANASLVWGTGNEVINSIENVTFSTDWNKTSASDAQREIIKAMQTNQYAGGSVMAIGGGNKADGATYSQLLGVQNKLTGNTYHKDGDWDHPTVDGVSSQYNMIDGYNNTAQNVNHAYVIGTNNTIQGKNFSDSDKTKEGTLNDDGWEKAQKDDNLIVIGDNHTLANDVSNNIILGTADNTLTTSVSNVVVIGHNANATVDGGVAIGTNSVADRAVGFAGAFAPGAITDANKFIWTATAGAVSVGNAHEKITRQITGVAAGTNDTDAVNVAQLKNALKSIDVDAGTGIKVDKITKDGKTTYKISTNIKGYTTTTDTTTVTPNQTDVGSTDTSHTVTSEETNTGSTDTSQGTTESTKTGETVTVSTTTNPTYFGADDNQKAEVKPSGTLNINGDGKNISTSVNGNSIKVELKKDITVNSVTANSVKVGDTSISTDGLTIQGGPSITKTGIDGGNQKVTGVAAGDISADSKDAVNGSQLFATNQQVAQNAQSINKLGNRVNKVGAGAAALAALHPLDFDPDAKWDFAAGYGNYRGTNAAAVGAYYRPNEDTMFSVGGTFGNGENMVNAGVSFKLGAGSSHVSTSRVAMAKEIKELRGELEAMKSAMLDANAGKKIDTSKLQLFPDVPQNHWAYEYVTQLAGNGMIEGYPDGNFAGDRPMTRYEFAAILYRAMTKGAVLSDKILNEFSHELEYFTVDTVAKDKAGNPTIQRVRTVKANTNK